MVLCGRARCQLHPGQYLLAGFSAGLLKVFDVDGDDAAFGAVVEGFLNLLAGAVGVGDADPSFVQILIDLPERGGASKEA